MQIIADLHTHTLSATHAFNTLDEMAAKAAALGYAALAITDHGPAMPDAPHMWHFANQTALPLVLHGVAMMYGAEANVMDTNGGLDFAQSRLRALDWVVASIHSPCIPGLLTEKEATRLWLAVAENPYVDCIGHSEQQNYRYDYDLVTKAFAKNHKVVELNGNSVNVRRDGIPNMKLLLAACLKNGWMDDPARCPLPKNRLPYCAGYRRPQHHPAARQHAPAAGDAGRNAVPAGTCGKRHPAEPCK